MNAELKTKWISALRSGAYQQGQSALNGPDGLCCLGVLCEVAGLPKQPSDRAGILAYMFGDDLTSTMRLRGALHDALRNYECELVEMNDEDGYSFTYIAGWIEAHIPAEVQP